MRIPDDWMAEAHAALDAAEPTAAAPSRPMMARAGSTWEMTCAGCDLPHTLTDAELNMAGSMRCRCGHDLLAQFHKRPAAQANAADYQVGRMDALAMYLLEATVDFARLQSAATGGKVPPIVNARETAHAAVKLAAMVAYPSAALRDPAALAAEAEAVGDLWRTTVEACHREDPTGAALLSLFTPAAAAGTVTTDEAKESGE